MNSNSLTHVYRHYDVQGKLLYIGISLSAIRRTFEHAKGAKWFREIANIKVESFETKKLALAAEMEAIKKEKPLYNKAHNIDGSPRKNATKRPNSRDVHLWLERPLFDKVQTQACKERRTVTKQIHHDLASLYEAK